RCLGPSLPARIQGIRRESAGRRVLARTRSRVAADRRLAASGRILASEHRCAGAGGGGGAQRYRAPRGVGGSSRRSSSPFAETRRIWRGGVPVPPRVHDTDRGSSGGSRGTALPPPPGDAPVESNPVTGPAWRP